MSGEERDVAGETEAAWVGFRARLADRLAELAEDELLMVEMEVGVDDRQLHGCTPYLQFMGWGGGELVRAEASSNEYLDHRFRLAAAAVQRMVEVGWTEPGDTDGSGSSNFYLDAEVREADRLAVMSVRALREVFGCVHPSFLAAEGLECEGGATQEEGQACGFSQVNHEPAVAFPENAAELRDLVDQALAHQLGGEPQHDDDGDVPLVEGLSVLFVRVDEDAPSVRLFADLVVGIADTDRAGVEVAILNRTHALAKFYLRDDAIVMAYRLCAAPFVPAQLRTVLGRMLGDLDDTARDLALRVGGRRLLEPVEDEDEADVPTSWHEPDRSDLSPALLGLIELLWDGPVPPRLIAALFDNDRHELIAQLVRLRTGVDEIDEDQLDLVLEQLRAGLRFVAEAHALRVTRRTLPPKPPRTQQLSLLPEVEPGADDALWSQDLEGSA